MSTASHSIATTENPFATALVISGAVFILVLAVFLHLLGVPLTAFILLVVGLALSWTAFRHPMFCLAAIMALMPIYPIAFLLAKFFGPSYFASFEGADRVVLLLLAFILWRRNGVTLVAADWFLVVGFVFAVVRLAFGGAAINLLADFSFMIAYAAGRVAFLSPSQQQVWAKRAVWIVAVLSVVGMSEVFVFGEGPRALLYFKVAPGFTPYGSALGGEFYADSFARIRESSTMVSPPFFALLCMAALVLWWVYCRNPFPAILIAAGLICTVTRSAWMSTALAIPLVALRMGQRTRFLRYAALALGLFIASIPVVGLGDYLAETKSGQEASAEGHVESLMGGIEYVIGHPFGAGPGNYERPAGAEHEKGAPFSAPWIESTYLLLASQYGILAGICVIGFVVSALWIVWPQTTQLGYAALGILAGFGSAIVVAPHHHDFSLACWIWFPVGMAVRSSMSPRDRVRPLNGISGSEAPALDSR